MEFKYLDNGDFYSLLGKEENMDVEKRIKYFMSTYMGDHIHFAALEGDKIVGLGALNYSLDSQYNPKCYHIEYISVDKDFRNQGLSKNILRPMVRFCFQNQASIKYGRVSEDGVKYVIDQLRDICEDENVILRQSSV